MSNEHVSQPSYREKGCTWCVPRPNLPPADGAHPVPGYRTNDLDGHAYFAVSTRWAGRWGENLCFRVTPDDLQDDHGT